MFLKKTESKLKYRYPLFYLSILLIPIFIISIAGITQLFKINESNLILDILQKLFIILLPLIIAIYKLKSFKSIEIRNEKIIIHYPFIFKTKDYLISKLKNVKVEKIKPEGNGPGFIEFPYKKVTLVFNNKSISFTSKTNKNIEEIINLLNKIKTT